MSRDADHSFSFNRLITLGLNLYSPAGGKAQIEAAVEQEVAPEPEGYKPENVLSLLAVIRWRWDWCSLIPLVDKAQGGDLFEKSEFNPSSGGFGTGDYLTSNPHP